MDFDLIELDADDDIVSICDRLDWERASRLLLVLPERADAERPLGQPLDCVRLRRHADRRRVEIGLVTTDTQLRRRAVALGIPTFTSVEAATSSRRGWWRGRRRRERVGLPTVGGNPLALRPDTYPTLDQPTVLLVSAMGSRRWLVRYLAIVLFCMAVALLYVLFIYVVPQATLTLRPQVIEVTAVQPITVDPELTAVAYDRLAVPGRVLIVEEEWETAVATTGQSEQPTTAARGQVIFTNQGNQPQTLPANSRLLGDNGLVFLTVATVTLQGVTDSTAAVDVIAEQPGPQGNVAAGTITTLDDPLAEQILVTNPNDLSGGAVEMVPAVAEADQSRARSQLLQFLQAVALSRMEVQLTEREFLPAEAVRVTAILQENYSHAVGEAAGQLSLSMRVEMRGTAVDVTDAAGLVYGGLAAQVPPGYYLAADNISVVPEAILAVDDAGRMTVNMRGSGLAAVDLDFNQALQAIRGQEVETAVAYLYQQLPLRDPPHLQIWPTWFERVPYLNGRIHTEIELAADP
ncbi:MAG: baseplate J/gp47 family protein [Chloroflexota bacterium]